MNEKLPLRCNRCHGPLDLTISAPDGRERLVSNKIAFRCPYCGALNEFTADWSLVFVDRAGRDSAVNH